MAFDILKKRALETAEIELVEGDGSPLYDDDGKRLSVTVNGPGSKVWQQANAEMNRRRTQRIEKNRGKITAALEHAQEDQVDFLCRVTISFNGWEYPAPDGKKWPTQDAMFRAAYEDDTIGYIRDHVDSEARDWSAFTRGSGTA